MRRFHISKAHRVDSNNMSNVVELFEAHSNAKECPKRRTQLEVSIYKKLERSSVNYCCV